MARLSVLCLIALVLAITVNASNPTINIVTDTWVQITTPINPPTQRAYHTAVYNPVNNTVLIHGGLNGKKIMNDTSAFYMANSTWSTTYFRSKGVSPKARYGHSAAATGMNYMVIFGGMGEGNVVFNDTAFFNMVTSEWLPINCVGIIPTPRYFHSAIVDRYAHKMFIYGGTNGKEYFSDVYSLDLTTYNWTRLDNGTAPVARYSHSAVMGALGEMVVYGGTAGKGALSDVSCFHTTEHYWRTCGSTKGAPGARYGHSAVISPLQMMVVFGGRSAEGKAMDDIETFDMNSGKWVPAVVGGLAISARAYHTATPTPFGTMVIFGGTTADGSASKDFAVYNLASTVLRSAYDGTVLVVIITLLGVIVLALCFAVDYNNEQNEIEKEEAIEKARQEALLLPKLPTIPKALHIPLGPRAQKFLDEFKTSLDPLHVPQ